MIEQLSEKNFDPQKYEDGYRQALLEAVDRKVAGEEIVVAPVSEPKEQIIDLVAALKQSLADRAEKGDKRPGSAAKAKPAAR